MDRFSSRPSLRTGPKEGLYLLKHTSIFHHLFYTSLLVIPYENPCWTQRKNLWGTSNTRQSSKDRRLKSESPVWFTGHRCHRVRTKEESSDFYRFIPVPVWNKNVYFGNTIRKGFFINGEDCVKIKCVVSSLGRDSFMLRGTTYNL